ncbi:TPA: hypothetical protein GE496_21600 [Escherichia coli]|nr:Uncharacterised protein [Shigella sonnei]HAH3992055.1 hypothetical protein [Escherichia coli]HDN1502113.1 hypothetical protein [Escherichia coli]
MKMKLSLLLACIYLPAFSANALSDFVSDMQKTYSMFTSEDVVEYKSRGLNQPVWFRFSDNAEETILNGGKERLRLQINGTAVPENVNVSSDEAMKPSGIVLEVQDGTLYCDEMATTGCQVNIRVGNEYPIVTYAKAEGNTSGKILFIDENTSKRIVRDIQKTANSKSVDKKIYVEVPFFVVGNKEFKFGLLKTPLRVSE